MLLGSQCGLRVYIASVHKPHQCLPSFLAPPRVRVCVCSCVCMSVCQAESVYASCHFMSSRPAVDVAPRWHGWGAMPARPGEFPASLNVCVYQSPACDATEVSSSDQMDDIAPQRSRAGSRMTTACERASEPDSQTARPAKDPLLCFALLYFSFSGAPRRRVRGHHRGVHPRGVSDPTVWLQKG